jgi:enoyl-CoA hydratase
VTQETIKARVEDGIGVMTLNRPQVLNALNRKLMSEVTEVVSEWSAAPGVAAIVLHGEGRAFSAGFDMKESAARNSTRVDQFQTSLQEDFDFIIQFWDCPKPTIAAVHGHCLAGAFELALACDITVAAEGTLFGEPEVRFGSGIICMLLPWVAGPKAAKELLLTGTDKVDAQRAMTMGIVNQVVPQGRELDRAMELARDLRAAAPVSVQLTKRAINRSYEAAGMREALRSALDTDVIIESTGGPERAEFNRLRREVGLKAALQWRDARFRGSAGQ